LKRASRFWASVWGCLLFENSSESPGVAGLGVLKGRVVGFAETHAEYLANKIAALGGTPTTTPVAVPPASDLKQMLLNVHRAEEETIARYLERRHQAEQLGDFGLVNDLEDIISDETKHKEAIEMILRGL